MDQVEDPVETIVLSSDPVTPRLTPAEARCVEQIRARRRRLPARRHSPEPGPRRWWLVLVAALLLVALLVL